MRVRGVLLASVLLIPVLAGCAGQGREEVLKEFGLELPSCTTEDLTFSGAADAAEVHLAMSFTAPRSCVKSYLEDHGVELARKLSWPSSAVWAGDDAPRPTDPPFPAEDMKQFKLSLDPKKTYDVYLGFSTPKRAEFKVLLVPDGDRAGVYMSSISIGCVRGSGNMCPPGNR